MSHKVFNRTIRSLVAATAIVSSSYAPAVRADETNSVPPAVSTNSYVPVISSKHITNNLAGVEVYRINVTNAIPGSTNNFVETRDRMTTDENLGGNWILFKKNIRADTNGTYTIDLPLDLTKPEKYYQVGRPE